MNEPLFSEPNTSGTSGASDEPRYNMMAVTRRTGIAPATLRTWERRYSALTPHRTRGNYRLYSERDIAVLKWLKHQLDTGLSISRAIVLLEQMSKREVASPRQPAQAAAATRAWFATWSRLGESLFQALARTDESTSHATLSEAFALYSVDDVCAHLIYPVMKRIGDGWQRGEVSVADEHFASSFFTGRLNALFQAQPCNQSSLQAAPVLIGCAPGEQHEMGALMLALLLRRHGHGVRYVGANVPTREWVNLAHNVNESHRLIN
jgi:DNA-binding transcriptional MerR regulator